MTVGNSIITAGRVGDIVVGCLSADQTAISSSELPKDDPDVIIASLSGRARCCLHHRMLGQHEPCNAESASTLPPDCHIVRITAWKTNSVVLGPFKRFPLVAKADIASPLVKLCCIPMLKSQPMALTKVEIVDRNNHDGFPDLD